jgi:AraC-like DNA-binding protein
VAPKLCAMLTSPTAAARQDRSGEQLQVVLRRAELAARIARFAAQDGSHATPIPRLTLVRASRVDHPVHGVCEPALCLLAQGSKRVLLGDEVYIYDTSDYLVVSQNLPVSGQVIDATPELPYLGLRLDFDIREIAALMLEIGRSPKSGQRAPSRGIFTGPATPELLDPMLRLTALLESPQDIPTLAPLIVREILYRLLTSENGWRVAQMAMTDSQGHRVAHAIQWLQQRYTEPLRVEEMARAVHMSASSLHHHFKSVTSMSPLQYQKQLRLQEARRILLNGSVDAATVGQRVGYESPSQFSREYSRMFGAPPARDAKRLREQSMAGLQP